MVKNEYSRQCEFGVWVNKKTAGLKLITDKDNLALASNYFDLVVEHHAAITQLSGLKLYGSMYSLLRTIFETYIRGMYFANCATEDEIKSFSKGKFTFPRHFSHYVSEVEKAVGSEVKILEDLRKNAWGIMNDFTHTGFEHIKRRRCGAGIGSDYYNDKEVSMILKTSGMFLLLAAYELVKMSGDRELLIEVVKQSEGYSLI